ncbi:hypothetical protein Rhein_2930 [Rheinheimera sp. A13L]|nr:hypothetical protein Rhein_2930 [Rheinheimera sp. A13L]
MNCEEKALVCVSDRDELILRLPKSYVKAMQLRAGTSLHVSLQNNRLSLSREEPIPKLTQNKRHTQHMLTTQESHWLSKIFNE